MKEQTKIKIATAVDVVGITLTLPFLLLTIAVMAPFAFLSDAIYHDPASDDYEDGYDYEDDK